MSISAYLPCRPRPQGLSFLLHSGRAGLFKTQWGNHPSTLQVGQGCSLLHILPPTHSRAKPCEGWYLPCVPGIQHRAGMRQYPSTSWMNMIEWQRELEVPEAFFWKAFPRNKGMTWRRIGYSGSTKQCTTICNGTICPQMNSDKFPNLGKGI